METTQAPASGDLRQQIDAQLATCKDPEIGLDIMSLGLVYEVNIDGGNVLAEFPVEVGPADSAFDIAARAKTVAGREVARLLPLIGTSSWPTPRPIPALAGEYYRFPTRRDARHLHARGRRLL